MEENMKKLEALMEQEEGFAEALFGKETAEEVQAFLKEKGVSLTLEEVTQQREYLVKIIEAVAAGKELPEEELDKVAGGRLHRNPPQRKVRPEGFEPPTTPHSNFLFSEVSNMIRSGSW
ncbi:hypothetical protein [Anoxynatronum buryatiense]|uniref:Uncharacterized protein n=1 Tax=Anoxynatronum buryatiense TaxID=489973 RepID=A0AA45WTS6_9CLOT|nr:hypothetical protein [Anoxynatronum buryatiense]SMP43698.1 hypothetical protein SAMN06296020_10285 [Anoxynatronum buryatiense]